MRKQFLLAVLVLSGLVSVAQLPEYYNTTATTLINNFPLSSASNNKAQWIFPPNAFNAGGTGVGAPAFNGNISKLFLKLGNSVGVNNYTNFTISMAQNVGTSTSFGTTPAAAFGFITGMTQVFYQASGFNFSGGTPNAWFGIPLQTSFVYNPNLSLVVEIKVSGGQGNNVSLASTALPQRLYGGYASASGTAATGTLNLGINMITTPLPVQLARFDGRQEGAHDRLTWTTNSESHNAGFNLQHAVDGKEFTTIDYITTKAPGGNSADVLHYEFLNTKPVNGHNYYRLQQVDIDGTISTESKVIDLIRETAQEIRVYPNPSKEQVNVEFSSTQASNITVQVSDMQGRVMLKAEHQVAEGLVRVPVQINHLPAGNYMVQVLSNTQVIGQQAMVKE
jgi:hypothetical protein